MKKFPLIALLFFMMGICMAQPGEWVWIHGSNTVNDPGFFGVQGVSDPANYPPGLYEPCEWTDLNGNFWLYGGMYSTNEYGDVWKYNPTINEWTWMKGTASMFVSPNYGTIGIPSSTNDPGSRSWGTLTWVDNVGKFWMFGGRKSGGEYNDLWEYDPSSNNWTWMKGPQGTGSMGVWGIQGIPDPANVPRSRSETSASWTDNAGNLWLFGGIDYAGCMNDLWRYNISTNEWTWMKGSQSSGAFDVYGIMGVEDPANTPGGRQVYSHWKDLNGNFWFLGGTCDNSSTDYNDLWRYNPVTNNWAWFKGGSSNGLYGTQCISDAANTPGIRFENRACVTDANGNFWNFGGFDSYTFLNSYNDLWFYCVTTNKWTWISGDNFLNSPGNWGTLGVSSPLNMHNARAGSVMWSDQLGHLYIFGGTNSSWPANYNDLWKFTIDTICTYCSNQPLAQFTAPNEICPGTCTDFTNISISSTSYQWNFPGGNPAVSTDVNPTSICYNTPGSYDVTLIAFNGAASDTTTLLNYITVYPFPPPQGILQSGDTLFANAGATSYQWYENGNLITGATNYFYIALESGNYNVVATDANNCEVEAVIFDVIAGIKQPAGNGQLTIFPNPVSELLEIRNLKSETEISIKVYSIIGEAVSLPTANCNPDSYLEPTCSLDVSSLAAGAYFLELYDGKYYSRKVFTKR
jgi:hypothetical protein